MSDIKSIDPEDINKIIEVLTLKKATKNCPRCGHKHFTLDPHYSSVSLSPDIPTIHIGGPRIPVLVIYCNNCGFMALHALGPLGIMKEGKLVFE